jgi:hypothetical protein
MILLLVLGATGAVAVPSSADAGGGPLVFFGDPFDGAVYWQGQPLQAGYGCAPGPDGYPVVSCVGDVPLGGPVDTSTAGDHLFTVQAVDALGETTTASVHYTVFDVVPPTATLVAPAQDAVYDVGSTVLASYACADPGGTGIAGCIGTLPNGAPLPTNAPGTYSFEVQAFDLAGNHSATDVTYTVAAPSVAVVAPADRAEYEAGTRVLVDYSCDDPAGTVVTCTGTLPRGALLPTTQPGTYSFTVQGVNDNGATWSGRVSYAVVDTTPPVVTVTSPRAPIGDRVATYTLGQVVLSDYACSDNGLLAWCAGPVSSGAAIDTRTVGSHTFTVSAEDFGHNTTSVDRSYAVIYPFDGFSAPLAPSPSPVSLKAGEDIPAKFSLGGDYGTGVVRATAWRTIPCTGSGTAGTATLARASLSYGSARYTLRVGTDPSWVGTCRELDVTLDDATVHTAVVKFAK